MIGFKKLAAAFLVLLTILSVSGMPITAAEKGKIVIKLGSSYMTVDGVKKEIDPGRNTVACSINGTTFVPARAVVEAMGGSVAWVAAENRIDITLGSDKIQLWLNKKTAKVNGSVVTLTNAPQSVGGRTMIPIRFVAEKLHADVEWNKLTNEATILFDRPGSSQASTVETLVINDFQLDKGDYTIKVIGTESFIFIPYDKFKYAFKYPYSGDYNYPDTTEGNGEITASWKDSQGEVYLDVVMKLDSSDAIINGESVDIIAGPYLDNGKVMVPVNVFMVALKMKTEDFNGIVYIQCEENFPQDMLAGSWYSSDMNVFTGFMDLTTGAVSLPSFASSYTFNKDGTYHMGMISAGGFSDTLILQNGKFKVIGNTVIRYDIVETIYKGTPFQLDYKDKKKESPEYDFINNYNTVEDKIEISGFWHHRPE